MENIKYLADGRKVKVIGKINKTEHIVQEIFVTEDNSEIPSGENFTTTTLLDQPAKSWKEKEAEKVEQRKIKVEQELKELQQQKALLDSKRLASSLLLKHNEKFIELFKGHDTDLLADIMTGNVKYVIKDGYLPSFKVQTFEDAVYRYECSYGEKRFEGIRMLTLMGIKGSRYPSEQKMRISISDYVDSSSGPQNAMFFKDEDGVRTELTKRMYATLEERENKKHKAVLTQSEIKELQEWITVPEHLIKESEEHELSLIKSRYEDAILQAEKQRTKMLQTLRVE